MIPLAALCTILIESKQINISTIKDKIKQWYWCGVLGELYGSANETKFDGRTQWVFVSEYNEVSITEPTKEELREINPLAMIEYYVSKDKISQGEDGAINFYPTDPKESEYFRIELRLNKSNLPTRLVIHQKNGDKITLVWDSLNKTKVDDEYFAFDVAKYPNVEVNDLR